MFVTQLLYHENVNEKKPQSRRCIPTVRQTLLCKSDEFFHHWFPRLLLRNAQVLNERIIPWKTSRNPHSYLRQTDFVQNFPLLFLFLCVKHSCYLCRKNCSFRPLLAIQLWVKKKTDLDWIDEDNARNTFGATIPLLIVRWKRGEI